MFKIMKTITNIKNEQRQINDRLEKKTAAFDKEWNKWGKKQVTTERKLP